jgi:hypothetical protein
LGGRATIRVNHRKSPIPSWRFAVLAFAVTGSAGGIVPQSLLVSKEIVA